MNKLKAILLVLVVFSASYSSKAQLPVLFDLAAYYSFDNCDATDDSGNLSDGVILGDPQCVCGVSGNALELDGIDDYILFLGLVSNSFNTGNFSVSFYFKSFGQPATQDILSKREDCTANNAFSITYTPTAFLVNAELSEDTNKSASAAATLDFDNCWHHVVLVRKGGKSSLYLDGILRQEASAISRVDLSNNAVLSLGNSPCIGGGINRFKGYIDELAVYSRDLTATEVDMLYYEPDHIANATDTLIFLGNSVAVNSTETCVDDFNWFPAEGVDNPDADSTFITPTETTTYTLNFVDDNGCIARDTMRITVIDPSTLGCEEIFLPKAFTPNGDNLNDTYGISNPYIVQELISFEIFDKWGGRVFMTDDPFEQWDGTFRGSTVNPGTFLYKVNFTCEGEEKVQTGSITIVK